MANNTGKKFGGRQKGTPNKLSSTIKDKIHAVVTAELENFESLLALIDDPKDRIDALCKLLPYVVPKQQEVTQTTEFVNEIILTDATKH